jgi:anhydro-N-acetylmuramic acid kinase
MSGTSLDGVDAVLTAFTVTPEQLLQTKVLSTFSLPFSADLRQELLALNEPGANEIERSAIAGNQLASCANFSHRLPRAND